VVLWFKVVRVVVRVVRVGVIPQLTAAEWGGKEGCIQRSKDIVRI
jgi:hypothetical protein